MVRSVGSPMPITACRLPPGVRDVADRKGPFGFQGESNVVAHCWVRYCPSRLNSVWSFPVAWIGPIRSGSSTSS